ncbi:hypothetical protein NLW58_004519 [Enterobacter hormaechei]|nr:hypothetical protein [Enterobacter hormaechei]EJK8939209.1 hypothetical protein [Enterobacter hormaechei]EKV5716099.1 hypothetical protein [Enterobacter hormaechei]
MSSRSTPIIHRPDRVGGWRYQKDAAANRARLDCDEPHGSREKMTTAEREMARLLNQPGVSEND